MSSVNASNGGMLRLSNQGQTVRKRVNIFACSLNQNSGSLFRAFCVCRECARGLPQRKISLLSVHQI